MRRELRALRERCQQRVHELGVVRIAVAEDSGSCPRCGGPMRVQKTIDRTGRTIQHGQFDACETVLVCAAGCRWPSGAPVVGRAGCLEQCLPPRCTVGYDVMVFVGLQRFGHHRQREEIRQALLADHGLSISAGEVSELQHRFVSYLQRLHLERRDAIRQALAADGGWPLHIDATGEDGRGTLLIAYAGWRRWVLGAWKIPTEHADAILPCLRAVAECFGWPVAVMRDLGRAMIRAVNAFVGEGAGAGARIRVLSCHQHFLADVGHDLLDQDYGELRERFRQSGVQTALRTLARDLGRRLGQDIGRARAGATTWLEKSQAGHELPDGNDGLAVVRAVAQWVLDYRADGDDLGLPFDRPLLDLYTRGLQARRSADAFLRRPPGQPQVARAVLRLRDILDAVIGDARFSAVTSRLTYRAGLFDELRTALRLVQKPAGRNAPVPVERTRAERAVQDWRDVRQAVDALVADLRRRRPQRGPAQHKRQALDLVLRHLDQHGPTLWGHEIALPAEAGGGVRLVDRTNLVLEGFHHHLKHGERRRSGRKKLTQDLENLPAGAVLASNLQDRDYVEPLCGSLDRLPAAFAALDAQDRSRERAGHPATPSPALFEPSTPVATASLPKEDRPIVRSGGLRQRIHAAAKSRAPRTGRRRPSPTPANRGLTP
jgi:hypothetical protein